MAEAGFQLKGNAPQRYEQNNVPRILRPQAEAMLDQVLLYEGDRVLDVACGTGIVTRVAVERCSSLASIIGFDFNAGMLEVAKANTPQSSTLIEWQQGDMCALPFPDDSFDVVLCSQGLQFVPDKLSALRDMRRVLSSNGRFVFTVWSEPWPWTVAVMDALDRHVNDEVKSEWLAPYAWSEASKSMPKLSSVFIPMRAPRMGSRARCG